MALLIIGAMGSRILFAGGVAMLATIGVAGAMERWLPAAVAVAWCAGFVIPGIVLALKKMDELLLSRIRLAVIGQLVNASWVSFSELQQVVEATNGNLGSHIAKLVEAGYVKGREAL